MWPIRPNNARKRLPVTGDGRRPLISRAALAGGRSTVYVPGRLPWRTGGERHCAGAPEQHDKPTTTACRGADHAGGGAAEPASDEPRRKSDALVVVLMKQLN